MKKVFVSILALSLGVLTVFGTGCTKKQTELIMATNAEFPPYEFHDGDAIVGIDAEIAAAVAEKLGLELKIEDMEFDTERLKIYASKEQPEKKEVKDIYDLPPVSFLQGKQNGAQVSLTDKKILEHLSLDMHLPNVVINVMIEYILRISNNRLNPKFVDMVASEWARDGITTKEQALLETKKNVTSHSRNVRISAPDFMSGETEKAEKPTKSELDEIRKQQLLKP